MQKTITQSAIQRLRPGEFIADAAEPGLRVHRLETRTSYLYRYRDKASGKLKQVTIGDASRMPIADARDAIRELRRVRAVGVDPARSWGDAQQAVVEANVAETAQAAYTVRGLIDDYAKEHLAPTKRGAERERTLRHDLEPWYRREAATPSFVNMVAAGATLTATDAAELPRRCAAWIGPEAWERWKPRAPCSLVDCNSHL